MFVSTFCACLLQVKGLLKKNDAIRIYVQPSYLILSKQTGSVYRVAAGMFTKL